MSMLNTDINLDQEVIFERKFAHLTEHELHMHDTLEVSILLENKIRYPTPQRDYIGKPGDVFVFRPFEPHWNLAEQHGKPAVWVMMLFSPSIVRNIAERLQLLAPFYTVEWNPHIPSGSPEAEAIHRAAVLAVKEKESQNPGRDTKQFIYALDILVHIYRYFLSQTNHIVEEKENSQGIIKSIERLLKDYNQNVDMELIILLSGLKKTWFYKQFFKLTGLTPNDFINRLRLQHAVHLLRNTDMPVTEIAFESGFNSVSYFNKQFRELQCMTPRKYRRHMREADAPIYSS